MLTKHPCACKNLKELKDAASPYASDESMTMT